MIVVGSMKMQEDDGWRCVFSNSSSETHTHQYLMVPSSIHDLKKIPSLDQDLILIRKALALGGQTYVWPADLGHTKTIDGACGEDNTKFCKDSSCRWLSPTLSLSHPSAGLSGHSVHSNDIMPGLETPNRTSQGQPFDIWQNWGSDLELASPKVSQGMRVCPRQDASHLLNQNAADPSWFQCMAMTKGRNKGVDGSNCMISFSSSESNSNLFATCSGSLTLSPTDINVATDSSATSAGHGSKERSKTSSKGSDSSTHRRRQHGIFGYNNMLPIIKAGNTSERIMEITYQEITQYFDIPITLAAKKLNVGLTVLKKRCRELGIPRWPHRKMKSIDSLIHNVKDLADEHGTKSYPRVQDVVKELEQQKRIMEEMPGVDLADRTKKLRQACFKENYKKRRLGMMGGDSSARSLAVGRPASPKVRLVQPPSFGQPDLNPVLILPLPSIYGP